MPDSDVSSFSENDSDVEDDVYSLDRMKGMSDEDLQGINLARVDMNGKTLKFLLGKRRQLTNNQQELLKQFKKLARKSRQREEAREQRGIQIGVASLQETVTVALEKNLFSSIAWELPKSTARTPSSWALTFTSLMAWEEFEEEVIYSEDFTGSDFLGEMIAKVIFNPLQKLDIRQNADSAKIHFLTKVCYPFQTLGQEVANFPEISIESEQNIGLALKSDINLLAIENENGRQVSRVFCVIEAKRPNQFLTEHGGRTNQTVEKRRKRAENIEAANDPRGHLRAGLCQLLGYMVIYGLKYGVLTSFELTYFCKRDETGQMWVSKGFYGIQKQHEPSVNFTMAAFIYKILHDNERRLPYPSLQNQSVEVQEFYLHCQESWGGKPVDRNNTLEILENVIGRACAEFIRTTIKRAAGENDEIEALRDRVASLLPLNEEAFSIPLPWEEDFNIVAEGVARIPWISYEGFTWNVFVKAMLISKDWPAWVWAENKEAFLKEVEFYKGPLHKLQGLYIPFLVYGGVFHDQVIIATTSSGLTATKELVITHRDWAPRSIRKSLACVHQAGVLHGDIAWRNIALDLESKTAHLIDFGRATQHKDPKEFEKLQTEEKEALEDLLSCVSARKRLRDSFRSFKEALGV